MKERAIIIGIVVVGLILFRNHFRAPDFHIVEQIEETIPASQVWIYSLKLIESADIRLNLWVEYPATINVFWLNNSDHQKVQNETVEDEEAMLAIMARNMILNASEGTSDLIYTFNRGSYNFYFEPNEYGENNAVKFKAKIEIK